MKAKKVIKVLKELKRICVTRRGCTYCPFLCKSGGEEHCAFSQLYGYPEWKQIKKKVRRLF